MSNDKPSSEQIETINCPHCGAVATYKRGVASVQCAYCGQSIPVPRTPAPRVLVPSSGTDRSSMFPWRGGMVAVGCIGAFIIFIIAVTVVLPLASQPQFVPVLDTTALPRATLTAAPSPTPAPTATPAFGSVVRTFGHLGIGSGAFTNATTIGTDGKGNIYIGERKGGRVQVFSAAGKFVTQWFVGNAKSILYSLVASHDGSVYVALDGGVGRFDGATGKPLGVLEYSGGGGFETITLNPDGGLAGLHYIENPQDALTNREGVHDDLVLFDAQGQATRVISSVVSDQTDGPERELRLAVDGQRNIYLLSRYSFAVFKYSPDGKYVLRFGSHGNAPDQLDGVLAIAVDGEGRVYISDSDHIKVFDPNGRYLASFEVDGTVYGMVFNDQDQLLMAESDHVSIVALNER